MNDQDEGEAVPGLTFDVPEHYGDAGALDGLSSVAAPLLAGGTLALLGVVVQQPSSLRWPGLALLLLALAAVLLVTAVQCGFWARRHATRPDEIAVWWPTMPAAQRWQRIREEQWAEQAIHRVWAARCRAMYGAGLATLWTGVAVVLVPTTHMSSARAAAVAVVAAAALGELVWSLAVQVRAHPKLARIPGLTALEAWLDHAEGITSPPPERWPGTTAETGCDRPAGATPDSTAQASGS